MSQLTEKYFAETGEKALYRMGSSDYHTLRYVNWLEKLVEGVRERAPNTQSTQSECDGCGNKLDERNQCVLCSDCYGMVAL